MTTNSEDEARIRGLEDDFEADMARRYEGAGDPGREPRSESANTLVGAIALDLSQPKDRLLRAALYGILEAGDPYVIAPEHIGSSYEECAQILGAVQMLDSEGIELRVGDYVIVRDDSYHPAIVDEPSNPYEIWVRYERDLYGRENVKERTFGGELRLVGGG